MTPKAAPAITAAAPVHTFHPVAGAPDEPQDSGHLNTGTCYSTPSGICTLRAAVQEANAEGAYIAIVLTSGTYNLTIHPSGSVDDSTGDLDILDPATITFTGAGITNTTIDAAGMGDRIFALEDNGVARMSGFTAQNGSTTFSSNSNNGGEGGAIDIASTSASLVLQNVRLTANSVDGDGGAIYDNGSLWVSNSQLTGNTAYDGGGLFEDGNGQLTNVSITGNTVTDAGGGIEVQDGTLALQGGSVSGNLVRFTGAAGWGGGVYVDAPTTIVGTTISNNTIEPGPGASANIEGSQGGGLYVYYGLVKADHLTIRGNSVTGVNPQSDCCSGDGGGGIWDDEGITLTNSTVSQNQAMDGIGGGIVDSGGFAGSTSEGLSHVTVTGNQASGDGGGIYDFYGSSISKSTISGNTAGGHGGGIWSYDGVQLDQSLIASNRAVQGAGYWNQWRARLTNDTFTGNVASGTGNAGGAFAQVSFQNSDPAAQFTNVTIAGNRSDDGGGIDNLAGGVTLHNTIISANKTVSGAGDTNCDALSAITDAGNNIDSGSTCFLNGPGSMSNTNPKLGALANNGGPTKTMALLSGSPAINHGSSPAPTVDQRGVKRGAKPDIGAFEIAGDG